MQAQARRFSRAGVMLIGLALMLLSVVPAAKADIYNPADWAPMVWSDKADYAPGEHVTLSGAHWTPGETVHIRVNDDTGSSWDRDVDVTADEAGGIADQFNLPNWFVANYRVTATGGSGAVATHTFTDANPQSVQIAPGSRTVAPGSSAVYTVTVPIAGNDGQCTVDLSASGLPAGATATFGNTSLTGTKGDSPSTSLTVATTGATPPGTTTFTVTAARQSNCQGNGNLTGTANLVVAKSVGAVAVGSQTGTLTAGTAGSATHSVTVNRNGATGTAFTANLSATGLPAGATASFSPSSVSFASGDTSKTSTLTITTTSAAAAGSTPFTVRATNPNATGDFSDGNGNLLVGASLHGRVGDDAAVEPVDHVRRKRDLHRSRRRQPGTVRPVAGQHKRRLELDEPVRRDEHHPDDHEAERLAERQPVPRRLHEHVRRHEDRDIERRDVDRRRQGDHGHALQRPEQGLRRERSDAHYTANAALESGDGFTGALGRAAGENAGSYAITLGGLSAGPNYNAEPFDDAGDLRDHQEGGVGDRGGQVEGVRVG